MMQYAKLTRCWIKKTQVHLANQNQRSVPVAETHQRVYLVLILCTITAQNALASNLGDPAILIVGVRVARIPMDKDQILRVVFAREKGTDTSHRIIL